MYKTKFNIILIIQQLCFAFKLWTMAFKCKEIKNHVNAQEIVILGRSFCVLKISYTNILTKNEMSHYKDKC